MPVQYQGIQAEHRAVRTGVGLFDVSHMGEIRVRGPEAAATLEWLVSSPVATLEIGQAGYGLLCNAEGGVVDDVITYRLGEEDFLVCVNAANRDKDWAWFVEHNKGAVLSDEGDAWVQIAIQGRQATSTLTPLTGLDLDALGYYRIAPATVAGVEGCLVARTGYTGEDGFEVFAPADGGVAVWDALMASGEPHGVQPIGLGARDTLRLEARMPLYGHELNDTTSPRMARLMRFVKDGGHLGADAIAERRAGETHFLGGLVVEGKRIPREGMTVRTEDGEEVGTVTSGTRSPSLGRGVALAYLRRGFGKLGTRLIIDVRGREAPCVVHKGAFYKRDY
jgi:aminomethyltransferase